MAKDKKIPVNKYVGIPDEAAEQVAKDFGKQRVMIFAWDEVHDKGHIATFGVTEEHAKGIDDWAEKFKEALGMKPAEDG